MIRTLGVLRTATLLFTCLTLLAGSRAATAQVLIANDDTFGIPFGLTLDVEAFGVLENDTLDGENAGESGAAAELLSDVSHGTLLLGSDGSFSYTPGASFDGSDSFVYRAHFGAATSDATVMLSACSGGPDLFTCWNETAYLQKATELGLYFFIESFEDDATWGGVRSPDSASTISSRGVSWQSNHPDAPANNTLTTGPGPAYVGQWGVYDPKHGYAPTPSLSCDNNENPPIGCFYHDGVTGIRELGQDPLHGVGGYFSGIYGAKIVAILDGDELNPIGLGQLGTGSRFLGVIDASPPGFARFEFREIEGRAGNALYVWADHFSLLTPNPPPAVPSMSIGGMVLLGLLVARQGARAIGRPRV